MSLKSKVTGLTPGLLVMLLLISHVAARNLKEGEVVRNANEVGNAKLVGLGGFYPGFVGAHNYYYGGNFPGYGVEGCLYGCCGAYIGGDCSRCCSIRG